MIIIPLIIPLRYTQVTMDTPTAAVTHDHENITPASATSSGEEFIVVVTPKKDYHLKMEATKLPPIQET